ncbi:DNA-binding protein [Paenibacillus ferrarius]|uniref:DNA-binding protein n=1 Tax=Paenibacillus ferrarius TaxID=1469647 RepID=A0A1V4HQP8_9BACL|nr:DNA-binding protein [Paenibacillus ferrarius]
MKLLSKPYSKLTVTVTLALTLTVTAVVIPYAIFAEGPKDPAPTIAAKGTPNGKKVLFDNAHGNTTGASDWVIDGAFSDFANGIANAGYFVKELRQTKLMTYDDLKDYDIFVTAESNVPYKVSEQAAMLEYVNKGGSIFFIADHYNADRNKNRWDGSEVYNGYRRGAWDNPAKGMSTEEANSAAMKDVVSSDWLSDNFGIKFRYNALGDLNANIIVAQDQAFGITKNVESVAMHAGSTLAVTDPNKAKGIVYVPKNPPKWSTGPVDKAVYNGGGIEEGPYVAVAKVGKGKAAFIGDSSAVEDATPKYKREDNGKTKTTYDGYKEKSDSILLQNVIDWLGKKENFTSLSQVQGLTLDQKTPLLTSGKENEIPQQSVEPLPEPWAAPDPGYKWWDPSTFAAGSYGK